MTKCSLSAERVSDPLSTPSHPTRASFLPGQVTLALCLAIALTTTLIAATYAWTDTTQHKTNEFIGSFTHPAPPDAGLIITKEAQNADGTPLSKAQQDQDFVFIVSFEGTDLATPLSYLLQDMASQETSSCLLGEESTVTLKSSQRAVFGAMPTGTRYSVTESQTPGYVSSRQEYKGTLNAASELVLPFVNVAGEEKGDGSIEISKTVSGTGAESDRSFSFKVSFEATTLPDPIYYLLRSAPPAQSSSTTETVSTETTSTETTCVLGADKTVQLKSGQSAYFDNLAAGTVYHISEEDYTQQGYITDIRQMSGKIIGNKHIALKVTNHKDTPEEPGDELPPDPIPQPPQPPQPPTETPETDKPPTPISELPKPKKPKPKQHRPTPVSTQPTGDDTQAWVWAAIAALAAGAFYLTLNRSLQQSKRE